MRRFFLWWLLLLLVAGGGAGAAPAGLAVAAAPRLAEPSQDAARVLELIDRRLALMPEVAAWKWARKQPILDAARERQVLDQSVADAVALRLEGEAARAFFDVQIRMARAVQAQAIKSWQERGVPPPPARDLAQQIRPQLDGIGRELLAAVFQAAGSWGTAPESEWRRQVAALGRHEGVDDALRAELARVLPALKIGAPASLAAIRRAGVLRIGTTGDYAPFSRDGAGGLAGCDVQLALDLARHWGVTPRFVRTTWAELVRDLQLHRFDLAVGGISVTPERSALAEFSAPYLRDGKTPIARCEDAARFARLEQIDQPGVRVVVNPGGTNERFVRERIHRATILVFPDNRTIFEEIVARRADVMITDVIEVRLQTRRLPALCGTMAEPLLIHQKAVLLPRGTDLTAAVNAWLEPQVATGEMAARVQRAVEAAR